MDTEIKTPPETKTDLGHKLLFHGTSREPNEELMSEHGLLAKSPTLTPRLELALSHAAGDMLTCWYPKRGEVTPVNLSANTPTTPLTEEDRAQIIEKIEQEHADEWYKTAIIRLVNNAKTILPSSRLGATVYMGRGQDGRLQMALPSDREDVLKGYKTKKDAWIEKVKNLLDQCEIHAYDEGMNSQRLAEDIVATNFEHKLLKIGHELRYDKKQKDKPIDLNMWKKQLAMLQEIEFGDPVYDRYRTILTSGIQNLLERSSSQNHSV